MRLQRWDAPEANLNAISQIESLQSREVPGILDRQLRGYKKYEMEEEEEFCEALEDDVVVPLKMPRSKDLITDDKIRLDLIR